MPLRFVQLKFVTGLDKFPEKAGHDFWLGSLAGVDHWECENAVMTLKCEDLPARQVFTVCYTAKSKNIKADADAFMAHHGLGLRRRRVGSKPVPGCLFLLLRPEGDSALHVRQKKLIESVDSLEHRLSSEARLRRTKFHIVEIKTESLRDQVRREDHFWLSSLQADDLEKAKKGVITSQVGGEPLENLFSHCFIARSENCKADCLRFKSFCGLGMRKSNVRAKDSGGFIFLCVKKPEDSNVGKSSPPAKKRRIA